jgi:hypothetical protein
MEPQTLTEPRMVPGMGKGLFCLESVKEGEEILSEKPVLHMQ